MTNNNNLSSLSNQNNVKCNKEIVIPNGFRELLQDMAVEVLRTQPTDIVTFCIDWLTEKKSRDRKEEKSMDGSIDQDNPEKVKKFGFGMGKGMPEAKPRLSFKGVGKPPGKIVEECEFFSSIDKSLIENLMNLLEVKSVESGEKFSCDGTDKLFIVQTGEFELYIELPFGKSNLGNLSNFGYFGDELEKITCLAKSAGKLIVINKADINKTVLEQIESKRKEYKDFIDDMELFSKLSSYEKRMIIDSMILKAYETGAVIINENDEAKEMFLIYEGFVSIVQNGKEISSINEGGYFGELAILDDQPRVASVVCITNTKVFSISISIFKSFIEPKCTDYMDKVIKTYFGEENIDGEDDSSVLATPPPDKSNLPRKSVSAGKFNPEMDDDDDEDEDLLDEEGLHDYTKTDEQRDRLRACCRDILLFRCLDDEQLEVVINSMFQKTVVPGDNVITRGEDGDNFYVIDSGLYDIIVPVNGVDTVVAQYDNKGSFGELALMYNTPRSATVVAKTSGLLWAMSRDMFRKIVLKKAFQKRLMYDNLLGQVPFLKELSSFERNNIADALRTRVYEPGATIIKQGEEGLEMYFIEEGTAEIFIEFDGGAESEMVGELSTGKYFGEMALINRKPRAATIMAKTKCKIAVLDRESFERLLGPCVDVMKRNMLDYEATTSTRRSSFFKQGT